MPITAIPLHLPADSNLVAGQSHFIKTVEDLAEIVVTGVPTAKFGLAFCEASGPCLVRTEGNDDELIAAAVDNAMRVGAGHTFFLLLRGAYPINLLPAIKQCPEVCHVFCATAASYVIHSAFTGSLSDAVSATCAVPGAWTSGRPSGRPMSRECTTTSTSGAVGPTTGRANRFGASSR